MNKKYISKITSETATDNTKYISVNKKQLSDENSSHGIADLYIYKNPETKNQNPCS